MKTGDRRETPHLFRPGRRSRQPRAALKLLWKLQVPDPVPLGGYVTYFNYVMLSLATEHPRGSHELLLLRDFWWQITVNPRVTGLQPRVFLSHKCKCKCKCMCSRHLYYASKIALDTSLRRETGGRGRQPREVHRSRRAPRGCTEYVTHWSSLRPAPLYSFSDAIIAWSRKACTSTLNGD